VSITPNIAFAAFLIESVLDSFFVLTVCICNFLEKKMLAKELATRKMLVKLTTDQEF